MPPSRCTQRLGNTRSAAISVPTTMAITNEIATMRIVTQKPESSSGWKSRKTSQNSDIAADARRLRRHLDRFLERDRGRILLLVGVAADPLVVEPRPTPVGLHLGDDA